MFLSFVATRPLKCNERLINALFHSRCLDFNVNEKIIILKLALSEEDVYKDKTNFHLFEINYASDNDQTTEVYYVMVKTFLIQLLILRAYIHMICSVFQSASQLALIG